MKQNSIHEWIYKYGGHIKDLIPPLKQNHPYPKSIDNLERFFKNVVFSDTKHFSNPIFSSKVNNVYVANSGNVISQDKENEILEFSGSNTYIDSPVIVNNALHLMSEWSNTNYWHWFSTSLARLYATECIPKGTKYLINGHSKFVDESLRVIGIDLENTIDMSKAGSVFCENLYLPSMMGDCNKQGFVLLKNRIKLIIGQQDGPKRVYISRAGRRVVNNEKEVVEVLLDRGFQIVKCEDLSFEEQVRVFYNAEIVVAPHGAGLTNILFAKDGAKILELRNPGYFGKCYYYLSHHLGYDYWTLLGEGDVPKDKSEMQGTLYNNMDINTNKLVETLNAMGVE